MAKNEHFHDAERLSLPVPAGTKSGDAVIVGSMPGWAQTDRDANGNATVWMKGAPDLPVTGAVTVVGSPVYIPPAGGAVTTTATNNTLYGYALTTKGSGTGVIPVKISQV